MLDPQRLEDVKRRGDAVSDPIAKFLETDQKRRELQNELDGLRAQRNQANQGMAAVKDKKSQEFADLREKMRNLSGDIKDKEKVLGDLEAVASQMLMEIPNAPHESVPAGKGEEDNQIIDTWGEKPTLDFAPKDHVDLGLALGIFDFERAAKLSGSRFVVLTGKGPRLVRGLMAFMLDLHTGRNYEEVWPPVLVKRHALEGTGQLPKFEHDAFKTSAERPEDEFFLTPTAEVSLTNMHREEILDRDALPIRYTAYTPCFRAEAGSYGKDTRGMIRQHQFDKVELVKFTTPEQSYEELEMLRGDAEEVLRQLGLHYRVSLLCTGDLGFGASKTYDLEVWLPGQDAFREISSCSNCESFQARRARIRYRPEPGQKPKLVHTLNGSGLAIGRCLVALLEQYQTKEGAVIIPEKLRPYTGFDRLEPVDS